MLVFVSPGIIQQKLSILGADHVSVEILKIRAASSPLRMLVLKYFYISSGAGTRRVQEMSGHASPSKSTQF